MNKKAQEWGVLMLMPKRSVLVVFLLAALLTMSAVSYATEFGSSSHAVNVTVGLVDAITVPTDPVSLTLQNTGWGLSEPTATSSIQYATNSTFTRKIYVKGTFNPWPTAGHLALSVKPAGRSAVEITSADQFLMTCDRGVIRIIQLTYGAHADLLVPPANDYSVTVTYTLTDV